MAIASTFRRHAVHVFFGVALCAGTLYFAHSGLQGEYGVFTKFQVEKEHRTLTAQKAALITERMQLENATRRLGDGYLDIDLLDERARDVLGYARVDEVIIR